MGTTDVLGDQEDAMNTLGTRSLKTLALIATAAGAVIGGVAHTSASSQPVWVPQSNGCYALSDDGGVSGTEMQCPEGNGNIDVYLPVSGQWAYSQTIATANWDLAPQSAPSDGFDPNLTSDWEDSMSTGSSPTTANVLDATLGGDLNATWMQPNCVEVISGTCYVN